MSDDVRRRCTVGDRGRPMWAKGYCTRCYQQNRRTGSPIPRQGPRAKPLRRVRPPLEPTPKSRTRLLMDAFGLSFDEAQAWRPPR